MTRVHSPPAQVAPGRRHDRRPPSITDVLDDLAGFDNLPPPSTPSSLRPARRTAQNHPPLDLSDSPSVASSDSSGRRYTAQEKGKGRAVVAPIEIDDSGEGEGDESVQFVNIAQKRRRSSSGDIIDGIVEQDHDEHVEVAEEDSLGGGYSCPVCFCPPAQAVITPCGHILCAQCLHSSLVAAIGRNPNPYSERPTAARNHRNPRNRGGRGSRSSRAANAAGASHGGDPQSEVHFGPGPAEWNKELLQEYWHRHLVNVCEKQLADTHVPRTEWEAIKDVNVPPLDEVNVEHPLKGLWKVDNMWVVEGECPVCRNPLPGGYGPPNTGIGGIVPLQPRVSISKPNRARRRR